MRASVKMVLLSHLSDTQEFLAMGYERNHIQNQINLRLNFLKHLLIKFPDTSVDIDPDFEYDIYLEIQKLKEAKKQKEEIEVDPKSLGGDGLAMMYGLES